MSRGQAIGIRCETDDHRTPIHMVLKQDQALLTVEEAQEIRRRLKDAIKYAKRLERKWEEWTRQ